MLEVTLESKTGLAPMPTWLRDAWAKQPTEGWVEIDGARLRHLAWNAERVDLPALILVHGFRAHAHWWAHLGPLFAEHYRVYAIEMSGFGDSDRREHYCRNIWARDIAGTIAALGLDRPRVVAHSFGGVATYLALLLDPTLFSHAIFADSILGSVRDSGLVPHPEIKKRLYPSEDEAISRFRLIPLGESPDPHVYAYIAAHSVHETPEGWTWKFDSDLPRKMLPDVASDLPVPSIPIDYVHGDRSAILTPERMTRVRQQLPPDYQPVSIPYCDHHIMIEQPLAFVATVRALFSARHAEIGCT